MPRLAVIQAAGSAPFYDFMQSARPAQFRTGRASRDAGHGDQDRRSGVLAEGAGTRWHASGGVVEKVTEQEIADAKAVIGLCGIGCEPASAATLAGIRKLTAAGMIASRSRCRRGADGQRAEGSGLHLPLSHGATELARTARRLRRRSGIKPIVVPNDAEQIARLLGN